MRNPKADKAFDAMKALGISRERVKPALKRLLKLFDKKWEYIEAENYRVLVDAVFEYKQDEEVEVKRKTLDSDGCEPPCKKVHVQPEEDEASSAVDSTDILAVPKDDDIPSTSFSSGRPETSNSYLLNNRAEPGSCTAMDKGKGQLSSAVTSTSEKLISGRASSSPNSMLDESGSLPVDKGKVPIYCHTNKETKLDAEKCDVSLIPSIASTSKIQSDLVEGSSTGNVSAKSSQCVDPENIRECGSTCNFQRSENKFDIASLPSGDVKVCCVSALRTATSHTPDIGAILKSVEENFVRSHKVGGPPFSLAKLLEEFCKSFFDESTDVSYKSLVRTSSPEGINQDSLHYRKKSLRETVPIKNIEVSNEKKSEVETIHILGDRDSMKRQPRLYIDDITKGEENVKIPLVDEHGKKHPPKFFYIPRNIIYQKAIVNISLARISDEDCCSSCSGDCLSSSVPCACARITHGEFAYTPDGLLKEEFLKACTSESQYVYCQDCPIERAKNETEPEKCKGHRVKRFIKECWSKCGCNMQCGNRIVQRGIIRKLQVFWTNEGKGWGLRTMEDLPKGAFVCEYVGEVVTNTELDERNNKSRGNERHTYPVQLDADWGSESILDDDFALCLDATNYGNVARFINHRCCDANLLDIPVEVETVDHHYYHIAFFTTQEVKAYEELTWDYGLDFDDESHPIKAFRCRCGSPSCQDKRRKGSKSKPRAAALIR